MTQYVRQLVDSVLDDEDWTRRVVLAAVTALVALDGPIPTVDGYDSAHPARTLLRTALMDVNDLDLVNKNGDGS